jgi:hypothetical protein
VFTAGRLGGGWGVVGNSIRRSFAVSKFGILTKSEVGLYSMGAVSIWNILGYVYDDNL